MGPLGKELRGGGTFGALGLCHRWRTAGPSRARADIGLQKKELERKARAQPEAFGKKAQCLRCGKRRSTR